MRYFSIFFRIKNHRATQLLKQLKKLTNKLR